MHFGESEGESERSGVGLNERNAHLENALKGQVLWDITVINFSPCEEGH